MPFFGSHDIFLFILNFFLVHQLFVYIFFSFLFFSFLFLMMNITYIIFFFNQSNTMHFHSVEFLT